MINQKGMEMAIQIFIVLFVLLAVAMLVLQLVSQQFQQQGSQLDAQQSKAQFEQKLSSAKVACESLCNKRTESDIVKYCTTVANLSSGVGAIIKNNKTDFVVGVGVCEDQVYCPLLSPCTLGDGTALTMQGCKAILCNYWGRQFDQDSDTVNRKMAEFLKPGTCYASLTGVDQNDHWFELYFDSNTQCPLT